MSNGSVEERLRSLGLTKVTNKVYKIRPWVNVSRIGSSNSVCPSPEAVGSGLSPDAFFPFWRVKAARNDVLGMPEEKI